MPQYTPHPLKTGGAPRRLADFVAFRSEMHKLVHPARPDVDRQRAETLCLSLLAWQHGTHLPVPTLPACTD